MRHYLETAIVAALGGFTWTLFVRAAMIVAFGGWS